MKKIMFNDRYGLTQAVLEGRKTQTRRIMKPQPEDCSAHHRLCESAPWKDSPMSLGVNENGSVYCEICGYGAKLEGGSIFRLPYKAGEIVAVAQSYKDLGYKKKQYTRKEDSGYGYLYSELVDEIPMPWPINGFSNKMFVKPELMPNQILITDVRVERLQDISENDAIAEGIAYSGLTYEDYGEPMFVIDGCKQTFGSAKDAYVWLIDKISGKGTWKSNPYVFVYDFELVK